mmetsp:Transcript_21120/g.66399  ORF Transcript_21120/g.66399 Transcript_21120/m.66399 type:complete len:354 (+) Transcript_21120:66-1127(+)
MGVGRMWCALLTAMPSRRRQGRWRRPVSSGGEEEWRLPSSWASVLATEVESARHEALRSFVAEERSKGEVYPPAARTLRALREVEPGEVKVVILGQDPYHGAGQADGLAFSSERPPPSLRNVFTELGRDLGLAGSVTSGDLSGWAAQGVLLLNTVLTVRESEPLSHAGKGWEEFTDAVVAALASRDVVVLAWGTHARKKATRLLGPSSRPVVLEAAHPSPYSAKRGFFGSGHFSRANAELTRLGLDPIDWACDGTLFAATPEPQPARVRRLGHRYRLDLDCPYAEKDLVKAKGARWDPEKKTWFFMVQRGREAQARADFARWLPRESPPPPPPPPDDDDAPLTRRLSDRPLPF